MSPDVCKDCKKEIKGMAEWCNSITIDGELYCRECIRQHPEYCYCKQKGDETRWYFKPGLYRISHTFSSLYDGPHGYLTSLRKIEELYAPIKKITHHPEDPMMFNWGFGLTGHIDHEHYRISAGEYWSFFVFEPSEEDLELMKTIGIEEKEREGP